MGDKEKEEPAPKTKPGFQGKSGCMKKAYGRILSSYKERYISVDKTEILIYEDEDQKNCLERVDLENYDKCHEMKSAFKKKHRLVLLRSPKSTNKVHDMKFQAQSAEEKEAWIKALSDGISRAKNKIFDEVKVDESSNLEHVTRTRPKGNRGRRPPTRIHMKEVADVSSDGILRLDLDLEDAVMPNGTYSSSTVVDGTENHEDASSSPSSRESTEDKPLSTIKEVEDQDQNQTKVLKPPMPPTKQATTIEEGAEEEEQERKTVKPPASPCKDMDLIEIKTAKTPEASPDSRKKTPPMPPNKPLLSIITPQEPSPTKTPVPPPTPSKTMKPNATSDSKQEESEKVEEKEENSEKDITTESQNTPPTPEKSPKLSTKHEESTKSETPNEIVEGEKPKAEIPVVIVSLNDSQSIHLSPLLGHKQEGDENGKKLEEKSIDSGQHSDDNSVDSACEDALPIRDSLDELDSRDSSNTEVSIKSKPQISTKGYISWISKPPTPLKPQAKMRSLSTDNLLLEPSHNIGEGMRLENKEADVKKLENEVATEMEDTSELLSRASRAQTLPRVDRNPENILAEALEKLKKADDVLREVKKLKLEKDVSHRRKSW